MLHTVYAHFLIFKQSSEDHRERTTYHIFYMHSLTFHAALCYIAVAASAHSCAPSTATVSNRNPKVPHIVACHTLNNTVFLYTSSQPNTHEWRDTLPVSAQRPACTCIFSDIQINARVCIFSLWIVRTFAASLPRSTWCYVRGCFNYKFFVDIFVLNFPTSHA